MRKLLYLFVIALFLSLASAVPCKAGPCSQSDVPATVYSPDRGCFELAVGYEYQHFNVLGTSFHNNGLNTNLTMHLVDWITGASGRLTVAAEGDIITGFGGRVPATGNTPSLDAKSIFFGGGPHVAFPSRSRFEPWVHGLVGDQRFRFTQTGPLGSNSALGFRVGGGVDIQLTPLISWRVQVDYVGSTFQSSIQSNYSTGTGIVVYF